MRRQAGLSVAAAALLSASAARADDPRNLFGLKPASTDAPLDCRDGKAFGCAVASDPLADAPTPYALTTWLPASYLLSLPVADQTHDQVASYALGAGTDGAGVVLGGATGAENRWTVDGAPIDSVRTGTAELKLPLVFLSGLRVTAGGFGARDRTSTGGVIDAQLVRGGDTQVIAAYAWLGVSAPAASSPTPDQTYAVRSASLSVGPTATVAVVASGPLGSLLGGRAWYAAGLAPTLALDSIAWRSHRLVDANGDGVPDSAAGQLVTAPIDSYRRATVPVTVPAMARAGWDAGAHHLDVTFLGQDLQTERDFGNSTLSAAGVGTNTLTEDGIATYRGTWTDTQVKIQASWNHTRAHQYAVDSAAQATPQQLDAYVPAGFSDAALAAGCKVGETPLFTPCPVAQGFLFSGGAGLLTDTIADRPTVTAELTRRLGANTLRVGATDEDARLTTTERFTGGESTASLFAGESGTTHLIDPNGPCPPDPAMHCDYVDRVSLVYRTRYTAGYVEDTFTLAPGLVVDGGLRWEMDQVADALVFHSEPAPRLGVTWDPLGGGLSRLWASMGRSYALLAAGIGSTVIGTAATEEDVSSSFGIGRTINSGIPTNVTAGIEPMYQDELTAGAEVALAGVARVTGWVQARYLRQGFDTVFGRFDNPGRTDDFVPQATRDTEVWALQIETPPDSALALRAGYTYTQVVGSWTGAYDPRQGLVLYAGADFDNEMHDLYGRLPTDLAHRVFVEAGRHGHLGSVALAASTRLTVASGAPRDVLANADEGVIELLPRGADGRLPMTSQANLHLAARWRGTELTLDLLDLFDARAATAVGEVYTSGLHSVRPISGTAQDLVWLTDAQGVVPTRDPSFRLPTAFQSPFAAVLGARRSF